MMVDASGQPVTQPEQMSALQVQYMDPNQPQPVLQQVRARCTNSRLLTDWTNRHTHTSFDDFPWENKWQFRTCELKIYDFFQTYVQQSQPVQQYVQTVQQQVYYATTPQGTQVVVQQPVSYHLSSDVKRPGFSRKDGKVAGFFLVVWFTNLGFFYFVVVFFLLQVIQVTDPSQVRFSAFIFTGESFASCRLFMTEVFHCILDWFSRPLLSNLWSKTKSEKGFSQFLFSLISSSVFSVHAFHGIDIIEVGLSQFHAGALRRKCVVFRPYFSSLQFIAVLPERNYFNDLKCVFPVTTVAAAIDSATSGSRSTGCRSSTTTSLTSSQTQTTEASSELEDSKGQGWQDLFLPHHYQVRMQRRRDRDLLLQTQPKKKKKNIKKKIVIKGLNAFWA